MGNGEILGGPMVRTARWLLALIPLALSAVGRGAEPLTQPSILLARPIPTRSGRSDVGAGVLPIAGGALIAGWTSMGDEPPDGLLMRVNPDGDVAWRKQLGGKGTDLLWSILPDPAGGYVVVGFTGSEGKGSLDGWILHFEDDGKTDWERTYGGAGEDRLTSIQPTAEGWIAVGQTRSPGAHGIDGWVLRVDRVGKELSSWMIQESEVDRAFGIQPLSDGGCIIGGMTGDDSSKPESFDSFVVRLGPDGKRRWIHREKRPGLQVAHDIRAYRDGTFLVVGYGYLDSPRGINGFALRLSSAGKVLWERTFGGTTYDRANHAQILADDSAAIVGYSQRPGAVDEETGWDLVTYRLSPEGSQMALSRFGGEGFEFGRSIAGVMNDLWVVGHTSSGRVGSSVFLVRLDFAASK
jgi:hypothetical protein